MIIFTDHEDPGAHLSKVWFNQSEKEPRPQPISIMALLVIIIAMMIKGRWGNGSFVLVTGEHIKFSTQKHVNRNKTDVAAKQI